MMNKFVQYRLYSIHVLCIVYCTCILQCILTTFANYTGLFCILCRTLLYIIQDTFVYYTGLFCILYRTLLYIIQDTFVNYTEQFCKLYMTLLYIIQDTFVYLLYRTITQDFRVAFKALLLFFCLETVEGLKRGKSLV